MTIEHSLDSSIKVCVYCGAPNITFNECGCKRATKMKRSLTKPSNYTLLKSLGQCSKCHSIWTANDLDSTLVLTCVGCGLKMPYAQVKANLIKEKAVVITTEQNVVSCLVNLDYVESEAKRTLAKYYDIFLDFAEKGLDGKDCADAISQKHAHDMDVENGIIND